RDIKPSNILVRDCRVLLIDVAFAAVRPTPWRQAVDLANMMLTLALSSTPEHVYERALGFFAADDVAEAFAACRSITVPSQPRRSPAAPHPATRCPAAGIRSGWRSSRSRYPAPPTCRA